MSLLPSSPLLDETLRVVARRYRLPAMDLSSFQVSDAGTSAILAFTIEQARRAVVRGAAADAGLKRQFIEALARMIREAMREDFGDSGFQAMVLRHRTPSVREYASLSAQADQDRRSVHTVVNAIAHPGKQHRLAPGRQREEMSHLHRLASSASWSALSDAAGRLLALLEVGDESSSKRDLTRLLESPALERLRRLDTLRTDERVIQYQFLWDRNGPRSGSAGAIAQGSASQQRGAAVETLATQAIEALARRLNDREGAEATYRVVTSMRVPASIPASSDRAKSEWDVVLLRRAQTAHASTVWDVCLLIEAKASVDAATTDLPRLLRGLRLLAHAEEGVVYPFKTKEGVVTLRGASLRALPIDEAGVPGVVLYCCDAPVEVTPRVLSAASRMQLLSAPASMEFASSLAQKERVDTQDLETVWHDLLASPRWGAVLNQYPTLCRVRELMVHTKDLLAAVDGRPEA